MTANELLVSLVNEVGAQLEKALDGFTDEHFEYKALPTMFSVKETLIHLTECYVATVTMLKGEKYEWGSYQPEATDHDSVLAAFRSHRASVVESLAGLDQEEGLKSVASFVVGHDNYHVGQLVVMRMSLGSNWDPYSIYNFGG